MTKSIQFIEIIIGITALLFFACNTSKEVTGIQDDSNTSKQEGN